MECFAFGLGVGHQNSEDLVTYTIRKRCAGQTQHLSVFLTCLTGKAQTSRCRLPFDDLDDFLEALEENDDEN